LHIRALVEEKKKSDDMLIIMSVLVKRKSTLYEIEVQCNNPASFGRNLDACKGAQQFRVCRLPKIFSETAKKRMH